MFSIPSGDFPLAMMPRASSAATATVDRFPKSSTESGEILSSRSRRAVAACATRATARIVIAAAWQRTARAICVDVRGRLAACAERSEQRARTYDAVGNAALATSLGTTTATRTTAAHSGCASSQATRASCEPARGSADDDATSTTRVAGTTCLARATDPTSTRAARLTLTTSSADPTCAACAARTTRPACTPGSATW